MGLADGGFAGVRTGRIPVVPALAASVRAVGRDGAAHHLDRYHHSDVLRLALAHSWPRVGGS